MENTEKTYEVYDENAHGFYCGLENEWNCKWQVFEADNRNQASPEKTGYCAVTNRMDTAEEANELLKVLNMSFQNRVAY